MKKLIVLFSLVISTAASASTTIFKITGKLDPNSSSYRLLNGGIDGKSFSMFCADDYSNMIKAVKFNFNGNIYSDEEFEFTTFDVCKRTLKRINNVNTNISAAKPLIFKVDTKTNRVLSVTQGEYDLLN